MTPRERAIRLADLGARQRRAAAAANGLDREYWLTYAANLILDDAGKEGAATMRRLVAGNPAAGQEWRDLITVLDKQEREEAELEKTLARQRATELQSEAQLTLRRAGIT